MDIFRLSSWKSYSTPNTKVVEIPRFERSVEFVFMGTSKYGFSIAQHDFQLDKHYYEITKILLFGSESSVTTAQVT